MGAQGGPPYGPTTQVQNHCGSLVSLFLFFILMMLLQTIARETNHYGNEEWVAPHADANDDISASDSESKEKKEKKKRCPYLVPCNPSDPVTRKCYKHGWIPVMAGYILILLG